MKTSSQPPASKGQLLPAVVAQKPKANKGKFGPKGINWAIPKSWYVTGWEGVDKDGNPATVWPTVAEIAAKLGTHLKTTQLRAAEQGWSKAKEDYLAELARRTNEAAIQALVDARVRVRTKALAGAEKILDRVDRAMEAVPETKEAIGYFKALPALALAARQAQQTAHVAVGLPKDGVMPTAGAGNGAQVTLWARLRGARGTVGLAVQVTVDGQQEAQEPDPLTLEAEAIEA